VCVLYLFILYYSIGTSIQESALYYSTCKGVNPMHQELADAVSRSYIIVFENQSTCYFYTNISFSSSFT
jgi:hypothetical protein